ncbi:histidinol dehydrogenase [Candidatus Gottesmanbacteria bacterium]|nr:histidinol dehydrogenase [Candidatus Gottesmanbacteria bacterium]
MKITKLSAIRKNDYLRIFARSRGMDQTILPRVAQVMDSVRRLGDKVLSDKYTKRYGRNAYGSIAVTRREITEAYSLVSGETITALKQMIKNITAAQSAQLPKRKDTVVQTEPGITVWREWRAIEKVGLYIPGGKAVYPSSVLMTAIPAQIAGCRDIVLCSPPRDNGKIPPATLIAANMIGLTDIFKVGGAEAIAAMTYGTRTIPAVCKIFGAGNASVTAAKMLALNTVSIDMPAGPSEIFIIADESANPAFIAADLLADGEHGEDSACVLITTSRQIARQTLTEIQKQLPGLTTADRAAKSLEAFGLIALADSMSDAIAFTNGYAPEHLEIMTRDPDSVARRIQNAGSVFLGDWTAKAAGDYATGANHVLPTGGMAKMYPPLGVDAYGKWMQVQKCTKNGLLKIRKTIEVIAEAEQLPAHKNSVSIRFAKKRGIYESN